MNLFVSNLFIKYNALSQKRIKNMLKIDQLDLAQKQLFFSKITTKQ